MEDRELLELAAKAAGIEATYLFGLTFGLRNDAMVFNDWSVWNPLGDDGDAFRLAHKLGIQIKWFGSIETVRRAIVSSAADTGRMMMP